VRSKVLAAQQRKSANQRFTGRKPKFSVMASIYKIIKNKSSPSPSRDDVIIETQFRERGWRPAKAKQMKHNRTNYRTRQGLQQLHPRPCPFSAASLQRLAFPLQPPAVTGAKPSRTEPGSTGNTDSLFRRSSVSHYLRHPPAPIKVHPSKSNQIQVNPTKTFFCARGSTVLAHRAIAF
jgi:hypothetical protein